MKTHLIPVEIFYSVIDRYKNHPSIHKIKSEVSSKSFSDSDFSRNILVTSDEVGKMLKSLNSKKAAGTDRLPIKLDKNFDKNFDVIKKLQNYFESRYKQCGAIPHFSTRQNL